MGKPLISVIVPVYNSEKYLPQCVESILNQTYKNLELILVDDGSTDGSGRICDHFAAADDRVRVVHKQNCGVSSARNAGIELSTGEYIAFVDSDDQVDPLFLADSVVCIQKSGAELYICGLVMETWSNGRISGAEKYGGLNRCYAVKELIEAKGTDYPAICTSGPCCKLYIADIIKNEKIRFDDTMSLGEDTCFVYDYLACIQMVVFSDRYHYHYRRVNSQSLYGRYNEDFYGHYIKTIEKGLYVAQLQQCSNAYMARAKKDGAKLLIDSIMKEYKFYTLSSDEKRKKVFYQVAEHPLISACRITDFSSIPQKLLYLTVKNKLYCAADMMLRAGRMMGKIG